MIGAPRRGSERSRADSVRNRNPHMSALRAAPKVQPSPPISRHLTQPDRSLPRSRSYQMRVTLSDINVTPICSPAYQIMFEHVARLRGSMTGPRPGAALMTFDDHPWPALDYVSARTTLGPSICRRKWWAREARSHGARTSVADVPLWVASTGLTTGFLDAGDEPIAIASTSSIISWSSPTLWGPGSCFHSSASPPSIHGTRDGCSGPAGCACRD